MNMNTQKGATLIVALIMMFGITLLAITSMRTSSIQMIMSGNDAETSMALERAQSIVDVVMENDKNFITGVSIGETNCTSNISGCTDNAVLVSGSLFVSTVSTGISAKIKRLGPDNVPLPRGIETSAVAYDAAIFSVSGNYDETSLGRGKASVTQGVLMLIPKGGQ